MAGDARWNSNLHAFDLLLRQISAGAERALDVGCGEGETSRRLRRHVGAVVGIDRDIDSIDAARAFGDDIDYVAGDFMTTDLDQGFDVVASVAMLHHVDHVAALTRMAARLRPGGILLVVGLARSRSLADWGRDAWDAVAIRRHTFTKPVWHTSAPMVWPPPLSHGQVRTATRAVLPGAEVRRLPYFRYGVTWRA